MEYNGAELTIKLLEQEGVDIIAGIPGGSNLPLYDALSHSTIRHILTRHEQGAGYIAQGMARATGKAAVCMVTSGPGVTNLLTAIADAFLDSIPIIAVTGQVSRTLLGTDAFQEVDTCAIYKPVTKHCFFVQTPRDLLTMIPQAFLIAQSGRPGPVLIDIPKDVQLEKINIDTWPQKISAINPVCTELSDILQMAGLINKSQKPLLYIGGGIIRSHASILLFELARKSQIPVVSTLMGLGAFPAENPLFLGMLGMHGAVYTNMLLRETDMLIAIGVRFDDRATGKVDEFCKNAKIIHVDIDPRQINKIKKSDFSITGDAAQILQSLLPYITENERKSWNLHIQEMRKQFPLPGKDCSNDFHPAKLMPKIAQLAPPDAIITTDVGQHQMWTAQYYPFQFPRTLLTSGGLGTMGFGLPVAIGAALAEPTKRIICITGDGSILMNIQELATLSELKLNVTVIVMNNRRLGLVRQQQELFYKQRFIASSFLSNPDFAALAGAFGIEGYDLTEYTRYDEILSHTFHNPGPALICIPVEPGDNVMPMVPPGAANHEMIGAGVEKE